MGRAAPVVVVSATMLAQSVPPGCPAERPVDDIIAEVRKDQYTTFARLIVCVDVSLPTHCRDRAR